MRNILIAVLATGCKAVTLETGVWSIISNVEETDLPSAELAGCGSDDLFSFGAYKGTDSQKLIIEFEGGGICFNDCLNRTGGGAFCSKSSIPEGWRPEGDDTYPTQGFRNKLEPNNTLSSWSHIFITYCTCDFHWGDRKVDYAQDGAEVPPGEEGTPGETFHYRGYKNFKFVMDWLEANKEQFEFDVAPTDLLVTGCSAGGYGMSVLQEQIFQAYPTSKISSFIDSAFGTPTWLPMNLFNNLTNTDLPFSELFIEEFEILEYPDAYENRSLSKPQQAIADKYPDVDFTLFVFSDDTTISSRPGLVDFIATNNEAERCNYRVWVPESTEHCLLGDKIWFQTLPGGEKVIDALGDLLNSDRCIGNIITPLEELPSANDFDICEICFDQVTPEPSTPGETTGAPSTAPDSTEVPSTAPDSTEVPSAAPEPIENEDSGMVLVYLLGISLGCFVFCGLFLLARPSK